jgi:exopolysaccharide biosynthesis polyprenyl glycosylphosphotransferase
VIPLTIIERKLLTLIGDVIASVISVGIALYIWSRAGLIPFDGVFLTAQAAWFVILPALWVMLAAANDYYDLRVVSKTTRSLTRLIRVISQVLIMYLMIYFVSLPDTLPRWFIFYHAFFSALLIGAWRVWRPVWRGGGFQRRVIIVGAGWGAETIHQLLAQDARDEVQVIGMVHEGGDTAQEGYLGGGKALPQLVAQHGIDELILATSGELPAALFAGVMACYEQGLTLTPMPILYEQLTGRVPIEHVGGAWTGVLPLEGMTLNHRLYLAAKRLLDVSLSLVGLIGFGVLLPGIALLIRIDSAGGIFYTQERLGKGGKPFKVIKLRTMIANAEQRTGPVWAKRGDPRITRVGYWLRKTRLDEFPQLVNVLRGDMSLVGPRPERAHFVHQLTEQIPFYRTRLTVRPGVTGWAQVRYKYGENAEDALIKLQYDLYYIRHQSLILDGVILLRTVGKMVTLGGQ